MTCRLQVENIPSAFGLIRYDRHLLLQPYFRRNVGEIFTPLRRISQTNDPLFRCHVIPKFGRKPFLNVKIITLTTIFGIKRLRASNNGRQKSLREHLSYDDRAVNFLDSQPRVSGLFDPRFHKLRNGNVTSQDELLVLNGRLQGGP